MFDKYLQQKDKFLSFLDTKSSVALLEIYCRILLQFDIDKTCKLLASSLCWKFNFHLWQKHRNIVDRKYKAVMFCSPSL